MDKQIFDKKEAQAALRDCGETLHTLIELLGSPEMTKTPASCVFIGLLSSAAAVLTLAINYSEEL